MDAIAERIHEITKNALRMAMPPEGMGDEEEEPLLDEQAGET